ncbi:Phytochrome-like protein cph2 [compost metagenome]
MGLTVAPFALQLRDRDFLSHVKTCLEEAGLAPGRLTIEVSEALSTGDMALICENLQGLRALGVRVALSGGAAAALPLNLVGELQPDQLTVDLPAIRDVHGSERSVALLACLVKTGQVLRLPMAVRGIARESEMDCARTAGAVEAWGPWISPALPARDLPALLRDANDKDARRLA